MEIKQTALKASNRKESSTSKSIENFTEKIKSDKQKFTKICVLSVIVLAIIISAFVLINKMTTSVSIEKYIADEIQFTGVDGYGSLPESEIIDAYGLSLKTSCESIMSYIDVNLEDNEKNGSFSNGDKVTVIINVDQEGIKNNRSALKKIRGKSTIKRTYKVSGLREGISVDVFDAIKCYICDTTESSDNNSKDCLEKKEGYKKIFDDGIEVCCQDGSIKIYGDNFNSFNVNVERVNDKEICAETKSVKYKLSCDADEYADYGIVLDPVEKEIPVVTLSYGADTISEEDFDKLSRKAEEYAQEHFYGNESLVGARFYWGEKVDPTLAYFYKAEDHYKIVYFNNLKIRSDNSSIYDQSINYNRWTTIQAFEGDPDRFQSIDLKV